MESQTPSALALAARTVGRMMGDIHAARGASMLFDFFFGTTRMKTPAKVRLKIALDEEQMGLDPCAAFSMEYVQRRVFQTSGPSAAKASHRPR